MQLKFRSSAARDVQETYEWYEEQREGLGEDFLTELDTACAYLLGYPRSFRSRYKRLRVVSLARFPYLLYFSVGAEEIVIYAVAHAARSKKKLNM